MVVVMTASVASASRGGVSCARRLSDDGKRSGRDRARCASGARRKWLEVIRLTGETTPMTWRKEQLRWA